MIEGTIAGLSAAGALGYGSNIEELKQKYIEDLNVLRAGPVGMKIREGIANLKI